MLLLLAALFVCFIEIESLLCSAGWPQLSSSGTQTSAATLSPTEVVQHPLSKDLPFLHESHKVTHW